MGKPTLLGRRGAAAVAIAIAAASVVLTSPSPAGALPPDPLEHPDGHGITMLDADDRPVPVDLNGDGAITGSERRLLDVTMASTAIFQTRPGHTPGINPVNIPIRLRIYLPPGYNPDRATPYPVLYLLHGGNGDYDDLSQPSLGDIAGIVDSQSAFNGIVVMPEAGDIGGFANWYGWTFGNFRPAWETYHLDQLVPWIDDNFNTSGTAAGRAIAGLSMGGFGALKYAGTRHTGTDRLFSAVGSLSGAVDMQHDGFHLAATLGTSLWGASVGANDGADGYEFSGLAYLVPGTYSPVETVAFGPESGWAAIDPVRLAGADAYDPYSQHLYLYSGQDGDIMEPAIVEMNDALHAALNGSGVAHRYCRGPGSHTWDYWRADLRDFLANVYGSGTSTCTQNPGWTTVP